MSAFVRTAAFAMVATTRKRAAVENLSGSPSRRQCCPEQQEQQQAASAAGGGTVFLETHSPVVFNAQSLGQFALYLYTPPEESGRGVFVVVGRIIQVVHTKDCAWLDTEDYYASQDQHYPRTLIDGEWYRERTTTRTPNWLDTTESFVVSVARRPKAAAAQALDVLKHSQHPTAMAFMTRICSPRPSRRTFGAWPMYDDASAAWVVALNTNIVVAQECRPAQHALAMRHLMPSPEKPVSSSDTDEDDGLVGQRSAAQIELWNQAHSNQASHSRR